VFQWVSSVSSSGNIIVCISVSSSSSVSSSGYFGCERIFMFCYGKEYLKVQHWVKQSFVQTRGHASEGDATSHISYPEGLNHNCFSHKQVC
jgi:hypothetical protein